MKMKRYLFAGFCTLLLLLLLQSFTVETNYQINGQSVLVKTNTTDLKIEVYSPEIIRIVKSPSRNKFSKISLSVIKTPEKAPFEVTEKMGLIKIKTSKLQVYINQSSGKIAFYDLSNNLLLTESTRPSVFVPAMDVDKKTYTVKQLFKLSSSEGIYGLGQDQKGIMNYRNHRVSLQQSNMHVTIPFLLSTKGYGLLWDNYSATEFADNGEGTQFESSIGDCIDYYFIYGVTPDGVITGYRNLTGPSPMFGKWAFGFWQCRERYTSQDEIVGVVEKFRQLKIPLDNIVQDWRYWGLDNANWNSTEFGNPSYTDPKEMIKKIHQNHAHVMISVWPSFGEKTAIYKELKEKKYLLDFLTWPSEKELRVYDAFNPEARNIYWKYMNKNLFSIGMDAWWLDATEPEQGDRQGKIDSTLTALGSFKRFRNAFPLQTNIRSI
jgi:alpha-D-xyloside xylohydrolase